MLLYVRSLYAYLQCCTTYTITIAIFIINAIDSLNVIVISAIFTVMCAVM